MTRRKARENAFIALFESSFGGELPAIIQQSREENPDYAVDAFGEELLSQYTRHSGEVQGAIEGKLKGWKADRIARVNLSILRLAATEMLYCQPDMDSVVINEAVELAKTYGSGDDYQFVNGVLGSLSRERAAEGTPEVAAEEQ